MVIVSGPSGSGKTTVISRVLAESGVPLVEAVSATTRPPRPGEVEGRDYYFITPDDFARRRERGEFLECFQVFGSGHWYGTLASEVEDRLHSGSWVLLEIDVQGTRALLELYPQAITIFLHPGSLEELARRLRDRGTESDADITRRLEQATTELATAGHYQHQVLNRAVDEAVVDFCSLLKTYREDPT